MMKATHLFLAVLLTGAHGAHAAAATTDTVVAAEAQEDSLYAQGTKAMDEQRWTDAVDTFDKVAAAKGKKADAALYWKAYSLNKLNRKEEAAATCGQLRGRFEDSSWNRECRVLQARTYVIRSDGNGAQTFDIRVPREPFEADLALNKAHLDATLGTMNLSLGDLRTWTMDGPSFKQKDATEDDIKLLALNGLMLRDPGKGVPLMRDLVKSNKSLELRKQALFALARSKQPEAQQTVTEIATAKGGDPELQREAVQLLTVSRGKDAGQTLVEIYRNTSDPKVKRAALSGLYSARDAQRLVELARSEKDLNLKRDIVAQLAVMKDPAATDYMMELLK